MTFVKTGRTLDDIETGVCMYRAVFLQCAATLVAVFGAGWLAGARGAASAALGGMVCVLPNLLFALHLTLLRYRPGASFTKNYLLGEIVKLVMTFFLLLGVVRVYSDLHWLSMLSGLVLASQAVFLAFWKKN